MNAEEEGRSSGLYRDPAHKTCDGLLVTRLSQRFCTLRPRPNVTATVLLALLARCAAGTCRYLPRAEMNGAECRRSS